MKQRTDIAAQAKRRLLIGVLDQGFDHPAWHGTNFVGAIRGLTARQAAWRPGRGRHNIWEIVLHAAFWKHEVRRRLTGGGRDPFARTGRNWPALPERLGTRRWREDVELLFEEHRRLRRVVASFPVDRLGRRVGGRRRWTAEETIYGIAMHDAYHTAQIQLVKRLMARR
jgi:hypothetical protein